MSFPIASRWDTVGGLAIASSQPLEVPIPLCETCQQRIRARQHHGGMRGMQVGAILFTALAMLLAWSQGWGDVSLLLVVGLAALAVGGLTGFLLGTLLSKRLPAELGRYSPSQGTLAMRFHHPEYAARVLAAMRTQTERSGSR